MSVQETNKQICRDYFKAFIARDTAWMARHIAPDFVRHVPGLPFEVRGPQGVARSASCRRRAARSTSACSTCSRSATA